MERDYIHNIEKVHEGEDYCTYSFKRNDSDEIEEVEVTGFACQIIDALGNSLLKKSFQKFEK